MLGDLPKELCEVPRETPVIGVCESGYRTIIAASLLERQGYRNVGSMDGGMGAWNRKRFPLDCT
jgi:hydroxyacylglutathione hydrolase